MATLKKELKDILEKYGIDPKDKAMLWDCHGTLVLLHKCCEIIAAKENIKFDAPMVVESNSDKKTAVICVTGRMGDRSEWSFGEACPANSKNAYPYAMAEKRAKDRVILKLVGLAQYVYSEDEADDFKNAKPTEEKPEEPKEEIKAFTGKEFTALQKEIKEAATMEILGEAWKKFNAAKDRMTKEQRDTLTKAKDARKMDLDDIPTDFPKSKPKPEDYLAAG